MFALLAFLGFFVLPQVLFLMSIISIPNVKAEEIREWARYATTPAGLGVGARKRVPSASV
jgi:hypothetical protein